MRDRILALIFVVIGFAVVKSGYREDVGVINHLFSNCPCVHQQIVGRASIDQFKPLGRSDVELRELIGNPMVREFEGDPHVDEIWHYDNLSLILWMKNHRCIAAYPCSNVFH
jgi:hypothetical protein